MFEFLELFWIEIKSRVFLMVLGCMIFVIGFFSPHVCLGALSRIRVIKKRDGDFDVSN
jgi:hypothetical protein